MFLSLNTHFDDSPVWSDFTISIRELDPNWHKRSPLSQALFLVRMSGKCTAIIFYFDPRLPLLFVILSIFSRKRVCRILQQQYIDVSRYQFSRTRDYLDFPTVLRFVTYRIMLNGMDAVVVHSSAEITMLADCFDLPCQKFHFVPYFFYTDSPLELAESIEHEGYIIAPGRHRDFACFAHAIQGTTVQGVIVAGELERRTVTSYSMPNLRCYFEVPWEEYRELIARATLVVIPLFKDIWQRSLGQIALFEAVMMNKPVVAARTFQLTDYVTDDEVLFYSPGDHEDLRLKIECLLENPSLRKEYVTRAKQRITSEYTREHYIKCLMQISVSACHRPHAMG